MVAGTRDRFPKCVLPLLVVGALAASGCGKDPDAPPESAPAAESGAEPSAAGDAAQGSGSRRAGAVAPAKLTTEEAYDSAELGALHGTILFEGTPPERFVLGAADKAECKHHPDVDQRANAVVVNDGKLANVLVRIKSGYDKGRVPPPTATVTLDQRGCMYVPRVIGMQLGQKLLVSNSDPTNHNVHTKSQKNSPVNNNMGAKQAPAEFAFEHAEKVPFSCDIHSWMGAAVFVEEHPWFAVTDESGAFRIRDVPPGEYVVEAEHETLGRVSGSVKVAAGRSTGFTFTLKPK